MQTNFFILWSVIAVASVTSAPTLDVDTRDLSLNYRLPTSVLPRHYVIEVTPYFTDENGKERFTFDGKVDITLSTNEPNINEITLHANQLDISPNIRLRDEITPLTEIRIHSRTYDIRTHKYTLGLEKPLPQGRRYVLSLQYIGKLGTDMFGFYRSSYEENGVTKWLATTQMQPTHARRAFPCFDEPKFKATFVVKINRPSNFQPSISNTKIELTELNAGPGLVRETFHRTPIMSTYLVAFIVSEFSSRENVQKTFNVYARPKAYTQTEYSFNIGQKLLAKFDELFDYKYHSVPEMTKMSMAALPDFDAGAMENWGLLTYRETELLYDPQVSTSQNQQRVATVVAHEQAHMWFGDLVTCDWWKFTWLNEGFARYFQYFGTALVEPLWKLDYQFVFDQLQLVFVVDASEDTHPMSHDVNTPDEVSNMFDTISYGKGASVIRMMEHVIGSQKFLNALREYLKQNAFDTAVPEKLYSALQRHANADIDVAAVMGSWATQSGYPVITVNVQDNRKDVHITQRRFLLRNENHTDETKWEVPLNYATSEENANFQNTQKLFMLPRKYGGALKLNLQYEIDWIIFNVQQTGLYRVNYDDLTWANIGKVLKKAHTDIHVLNRGQIVDDSLNLARGNLLNYTRALSIIQYLEKETHYIPWSAAFRNFDYILTRFKPDEVTVFQQHVLGLMDNVYKYLGFATKTNDTRLDIFNRINVLTHACRFGHKQCIADAKQEFAKYQSTTHKIPVNLAPVVYCTVASEGTEDEWNYLWRKFKEENVAAEKVLILSSLGCSRNKNILTKYIDLILSADVRLQDKARALSSTYRNPVNVDIVLDYVLANHENITAAFGSESQVPAVLSQLAARFTNKDQIKKIERFVESNNSKYGSSKAISNALKNAELNLKWANRHISVIKSYLKGQTDSTNDKGAAPSIAASVYLVLLVCVSYFLA